MTTGSEIKKVQEIKMASYLAKNSDLKEKTRLIREDLNHSYPFIHRLSIALYHPDRGVIQTHVYDEDIDTHIHNYEAVLCECKSLNALVKKETERIVNDISIFDKGKHKHSALIRQAGYLSSVTIPLLIEGHLLGFLFANSREKNVFADGVVQQLRLVAMIFTLLLHQNSEKMQVLKSTIESMKMVSFGRDPETAAHQQRMASYSLLIARNVVATYKLTDLVISYIYLYAPLHDLGKLMIADDILLKAGPLSDDEFQIMQGHTNQGDELAAKLINVYQLSEMPFISMLRAIIRWHHEKMDGSGYPDGLQRAKIPVAARVVAVADIFDALTSVRPYKEAWTNEDAFAELKKLAGSKLDGNCVNALMTEKQQILEIQKRFKEKP